MSEFNNSEYLQQVADDVLRIAKNFGADESSVQLNRSDGQSISVRTKKLETIESIREQNLSVSVYFNHKKGSASSSDLSTEALQKTVQKACDIAKYTEADECFGLADSNRLLKSHLDLEQNHPWQINTDELIEIAKECEQSALDYSEKITNSEGSNIDTGQSLGVIANSLGFNDFQISTEHSISCSVIAEQYGKMQTDYEYSVARNTIDLSSAESIGKMAGKKAVAKLNPKNIKTGIYPVILDTTVSASIFGNFIQGISGNALYHQASFLLNSLNAQIFSDFINIKEQPLLIGGLFSGVFDSEGVATNDKFIVKNGIVQSYILSSYTARKLQMQSTANAGGVFNLSLNATHNSQQDLLKTMDKGLLVTDFMGSGTNIITGDYSRGVSGFWVENGVIQYPVEEITIAGNLTKMYQNIVGVADDFDLRNNIVSGSVLIDEMMLSAG